MLLGSLWIGLCIVVLFIGAVVVKIFIYNHWNAKSVLPCKAKSSVMSNPLSAKIKSPYIRWSRKPLFDVMSLTDVQPPQHLETIMITLVGLMATKNLAVFWLL